VPTSLPAPISLPPGLERQRALGPDWARWLDALPARLRGLLEEWELVRDGEEVWHGYASAVLPVRTLAGAPAVLKVTFDGDDESLHEALALQQWGGAGAARLLRADPARRALLVERLHREDLGGLGDLEACEVVAGLYARIHRPAPPQLRPVTSYVARWLGDLADAGRDLPLPPRMVQQALSLGHDLMADPASVGLITHGDLHYGNVLAADREPWLVIDPKPMSGDPHYEPAPMLWNRWHEVLATGDARAATRRRFHTLVDVGRLDLDRARDWVVVRSVVNAHWSVQDAARDGRDLSAEERAWVTMCVAVAKAVQE
jgi:streptomycin 6-kinase